jgi:hypothetical protein
MMALQDYFKKLNFLEHKRIPDGFGGWITRWEVGAEFDGLVTLASDMTQNTEALRGNLTKQYKISTSPDVPLKKGDKIAFDFFGNNELEYAEITNDGVRPPEQADTQFLLFSAQSWEMKEK